MIPGKITNLVPRRAFGLFVILVLVLVAIWAIEIPDSKGSPSLKWFDLHRHTYTPTQPPASNGIDLAHPDAPFIKWPLARVCNEANWVEGLIFICDNNSGGIGNIRNYIQTCIRYGIEAGATGYIMPKIRQRNEDDLADLFTTFRPLNYMFDEDHFRLSLNASCPQITIYDTLEHVQVARESPRVEVITPKSFGDREGCDWRDQNRHTHRFGRQFRRYIQNSTIGHVPTKSNPRYFRFHWGVLWDWPIYNDGPEFVATFGNILKFNSQLLRLGDAVTEAMRDFARSTTAGKKPVEKNAQFLGIHLRTESDSMDFWPTFETQASGYLYHAQRRGYRAAYLATGNSTEASRLAQEAAATADLHIMTKTDLLKGEDLAELQSLTWDQQAIVDFIALLASEYFVGAMPSSFSVYLTMKRHLRTGGLYTRPYKVGTEGDGLSYLVGNYTSYWDGWLFMFDGMWP